DLPVKPRLALCTSECQPDRLSVDAPWTASVGRGRTNDEVAMETKGLRAGHLAALAGALLTLASLWRPWYTLDVPAAFRDALSSEGAKVPGLGAFAQGLAAALPDHISASGWQ